MSDTRCKSCGCAETVSCGCVTTKSNNLRSDIEFRIGELLRRNDLGVVECDGMRENNIGLLRQLMALRQHFIETQGAMVVHVGAAQCVPGEFDCGQYDSYRHDCHPVESLVACPECFDDPIDETCPPAFS